MKKSVGLVLLLTAAFAYSGVEGTSGCENGLNYVAATLYERPVFGVCKSDPEGKASLAALAGNPACKDYKFITRHCECEVLAAPYMKCVAGKQGFLKADGSIDSEKIIGLYKMWTSKACDVAQFDSAAKKCGTEIENYAYLEKAACIARKSKNFTG
ncbi:uncharacterized protein LOC108668422 [Hyalella azteca]|uniref:Uncharacterized protein LOC108668422 n=1 Tax=Hyalella azteca TaxID=294128 RepID=A0A8B7NC72_HYAAZ|nr:uncharacterized protein LOC108668422 [Hyalella azteca]